MLIIIIIQLNKNNPEAQLIAANSEEDFKQLSPKLSSIVLVPLQLELYYQSQTNFFVRLMTTPAIHLYRDQASCIVLFRL